MVRGRRSQKKIKTSGNKIQGRRQNYGSNSPVHTLSWFYANKGQCKKGDKCLFPHRGEKGVLVTKVTGKGQAQSANSDGTSKAEASASDPKAAAAAEAKAKVKPKAKKGANANVASLAAEESA